MHKIKVVEEEIKVCYHRALCSEAADDLEPMALAHYEIALNLIAQAKQHMKLAGLAQEPSSRGESK
jgi:hypothetical protein